MNDSTPRWGTETEADLAVLLRFAAEMSNSRRGRPAWARLIRIVNSQSASSSGGRTAGSTELAALGWDPGNINRSEILARVLLGRAVDDDSFRSALSDWRNLKLLAGAKRASRDSLRRPAAIRRPPTTPGQEPRSQDVAGQSQSRWQKHLSDTWKVPVVSGVIATVLGGLLLALILSIGNPFSDSGTSSPPAPTPSYSGNANSPHPAEPADPDQVEVTMPRDGSRVGQCAMIQGTARVPPGKTLVLSVQGFHNSSRNLYLQPIRDFNKPSKVTNWTAFQYFDFHLGAKAVGWRYQITVLVMSISDVTYDKAQPRNNPIWNVKSFPKGAHFAYLLQVQRDDTRGPKACYSQANHT
jgi:hypothetical protein